MIEYWIVIYNLVLDVIRVICVDEFGFWKGFFDLLLFVRFIFGMGEDFIMILWLFFEVYYLIWLCYD